MIFDLRSPATLGPVIGERLLEVISEPASDDEESGNVGVCFCFGNGITVTFPVGDAGFKISYPDEPPDGV